MTNAIVVSDHHCSTCRYSYLDERAFPAKMTYTPETDCPAFDNMRFASPTTPTTLAGPEAMFPASTRADPGYVPELRSRGVVPSREKVLTNGPTRRLAGYQNRNVHPRR
ncbi:hypothetical protein PENNAL_c0052G03014 [Penicillium nalgiovense]|uniref:Uncharacterized protein n=1 Tax=Penicillium nalgiovense TaxID=60175 RepID=A0A1V6XVT9_PENNA|nr:hypothetical protein PENNAL_c0052G03014 [Penicillium nalgiovense]